MTRPKPVIDWRNAARKTHAIGPVWAGRPERYIPKSNNPSLPCPSFHDFADLSKIVQHPVSTGFTSYHSSVNNFLKISPLRIIKRTSQSSFSTYFFPNTNHFKIKPASPIPTALHILRFRSQFLTQMKEPL